MEPDRYTRITLRIPKELHVRLEGEADRTSKSLNAEIVSRLELSFAGNPSQTTDKKMQIALLESRVASLRSIRSNENLRLSMLIDRAAYLEERGADPEELKDKYSEIGALKIRTDRLRDEYVALIVELDLLRGEDRSDFDPEP